MERKASNTRGRNTENIKNKSKNDYKKRLIIFAIIVIFAVFFIVNKAIESKIADSIETFTDALKEGNREIANKYVTEDTVSFLTFEEIPENQELMNTFVKYLSADIKKVSKDGEEAIVKVKFSNKDFEKIMNNYMQEVVSLSISNDDTGITDEELESHLLEYLKQQFDLEENPILTNEVEVKLIKVDKTWKIIVDDNLRNGLFPGMLKIIESMGPQNQQ